MGCGDMQQQQNYILSMLYRHALNYLDRERERAIFLELAEALLCQPFVLYDYASISMGGALLGQDTGF